MTLRIVSSHYSHMPGLRPTQLCESLAESESEVSPVKRSKGQKGLLLLAVAAIASSVCLTGCQTTIGGQTLPSPDYLLDDVQYHPAGPDFQLSNKVAAQRKYNAERAAIGDAVGSN